MKNILFIIILFSISNVNAQNIYWDYPNYKDSLKKGDIIVLKPFYWDANCYFDSTIIPYIENFKGFMLKHKFKFTIYFNWDYTVNDTFNLKMTQIQVHRFNDILKEDTTFCKRVKYNLVPMGAKDLLIPNQCIEEQTNIVYKNLMRRLNNRMQILLE